MRKIIAILALCILGGCAAAPGFNTEVSPRQPVPSNEGTPVEEMRHVWSDHIVIGGVEFEGWIPTDENEPWIIFKK